MRIHFKLLLVSVMQWLTGYGIYAVFTAAAVASDKIVLLRMMGEYHTANQMIFGFSLAIGGMLLFMIYLIYLGSHLIESIHITEHAESAAPDKLADAPHLKIS